MEHRIYGELAQVVELTFTAGESCWSSKGGIVSLTPGLNWTLKIPGGLGAGMRRSLSGEGIALTYISASANGERAMLSSNQPGKIIAWDLADGPVITTRGSFVAAFGEAIDITVVVARRAGAAFFGGAGLFLQKISGRGTVLIHGAGDFIDRRLEQKESILVSTGNLAAMAAAVDYDIRSIAGCRKILFGGEGLFMTKLTGPGRVLLQTLKRTVSSKSNPTTM